MMSDKLSTRKPELQLVKLLNKEEVHQLDTGLEVLLKKKKDHGTHLNLEKFSMILLLLLPILLPLKSKMKMKELLQIDF